MTKSEFYKSLIEIQKQTGQGLSGIVRIKSAEVGEYLDELIEEGLVKCCNTGGSLGHPETNNFYIPTKGYNVWEDDGVDGEYQRHKGRYLHFVRFYLGIYKQEDTPLPKKNSDEYNNRMLFDPTMFDMLRNPEVMEEYSKWLKRNHKQLEIMLNLDDVYLPKDLKFEFTKEEMEWIKTKTWFEENKSIEASIKAAQEGSHLHIERMEINEKLIRLYGDDPKYAKQLKASKDGIAIDKKDPYIRKKVLKWMGTLDKKRKIQDAVYGLKTIPKKKEEEAGEIVNLAEVAKQKLKKIHLSEKLKSRTRTKK